MAKEGVGIYEPVLQREIIFESGRIRINKSYYLRLPVTVVQALYGQQKDGADKSIVECKILSNEPKKMVLQFEIYQKEDTQVENND